MSSKNDAISQDDAKPSCETGSMEQWLEDFKAKNGRPLKILHYGNIANNAYNNAKLQRANGITAHVLAPNYYHIMGCPEWEDATIEGEIEDAFFPDFWDVNLNGFERPRWFVQGPSGLSKEYLLHKAKGNAKRQNLYWKLLQTYRYILVKEKAKDVSSGGRSILILAKKKAFGALFVVRNFLIVGRQLPHKIVFKGRTALNRLAFFAWLPLKKLTYAINKSAGDKLVSLAKNYKKSRRDEHLHQLKQNENAARNIPSAQQENIEKTDRSLEQSASTAQINAQDDAAFMVTADFWLPLFSHYDIVMAYSTDPIWPFLGKFQNYIAYEHGTIREIPFQDDPVGRLTKRAYKAAPAVFITNVDNIKAADRMGLTEKQRYYLPHAFDCRKLLRYDESCEISYDPEAPKQIFMPSRQHWVDGDPNWAKGNDVVIRAAKILMDEGFFPVIKFVEWGNDVDASKALIDELGVNGLISWSPMLNKQQLWEQYLQSTAVIDQFLLFGISGVSFEAMTLGVPVITHDEGDLNERFFGKAPPLLAASTPRQVADHIKRLMSTEGLRTQIGEQCARWILDYHSPERIFDIQIDAFKHVLKADNPD